MQGTSHTGRESKTEYEDDPRYSIIDLASDANITDIVNDHICVTGGVLIARDDDQAAQDDRNASTSLRLSLPRTDVEQTQR